MLPNVTRLRIPEHRELYLSAPPVAEPIGGIASGTTFTGDQVGLFRAQPGRPKSRYRVSSRCKVGSCFFHRSWQVPVFLILALWI